MDWFERLTGFAESDWAGTQARLRVDGGYLVHASNGRRWAMGWLECPSLAELRQRVSDAIGTSPTVQAAATVSPGPRPLAGDARALHALPQWAGATFQVASQFNLLEMTGPEITPEHGITRYRHDATQGPACAMAAGAATIYRNYLVPIDGAQGQTAARQIDLLAPLGDALGRLLGCPRQALWTMRNGYALAGPAALRRIRALLLDSNEDERDHLCDHLRGLLRVGWHREVEVTDAGAPAGQRVSQVLCSAMPVAYTDAPRAEWAPLATLVLEAAYEATLLAAALTAAGGGSNVLLLTRLGGGAFGNDPAWIDRAMQRALAMPAAAGLSIRLVQRHG